MNIQSAIVSEPVRIGGVPGWMPESLQERDKEVRVRFRFSAAERRVYRKRRKIPVSTWAERHRMVTRGPLEGTRWRNSTTPYLGGIMDASFFPSVQTIIVCSGPQVGKSAVVDTCIGYAIDRDPGPVLYVYPDRDTATENARDRILPMIKESPRLRAYLTGAADDEAAKRINLQHMQVYMAWAQSAIKLGNKSIRYVIFDETDKYPITAGKREADPISLGEARVTTYKWGRKIWKVSTPTIEAGPIWQALTTEAQVIFDYWVRCPACRKFQVMKFEQIKWPEGERDPETVQTKDLAWYECEHCKDRWDDHQRDIAVRRGQWRSSGGPYGTDEQRAGARKLAPYLKNHRPMKIGFHIPSWVSHFVGLSEVAAAFLRGLTDKNKLKDFNNKHKAVPWKDYTAERKEDRILALRDDRPRGIVPGGGVVQCLTAGVDTQDVGFWFEVRAWGWGMEMESWQVREGYVDSFEAIRSILLDEKYADADGNQYIVSLAVQDAMGHRTAAVYDFVRAHPGFIVPYQGVDTRKMAAPIAWTNIEYYPGTKKPIPGGIKLCRVDANYFKNILAGKLEINPEDPGAWHLHAEATEEWARHMCAEHIDDKKQIWVCPENRANHGWDCSVMNLVAAELLRVKYQNPAPPKGSAGPRPAGQKDKWIPQKPKGWLNR